LKKLVRFIANVSFSLQLIILIGAELAQRTNTQRQSSKEGFSTMLVLLLQFYFDLQWSALMLTLKSLN
jgi:hypothetical protein